MDQEIVKALLSFATSAGGIVLGGFIAWRATTAAEKRRTEREVEAEKRKAEREVEAEKRKAEREDAQAGERERKAHLRERLATQQAALTEYHRLLAKWANDLPPTVEVMPSVGSTLQRWRTEEIESHADSSAISRQISNAFGSSVFGDQAGMTIIGMLEGRKAPQVALATHIWIGKCISEMRRCIDALADDLGLPKPKVQPEPFIPAKEFNREAKRTLLKFEGVRGGLDPERIDEMLEKAGLGPTKPIKEAESASGNGAGVQSQPSGSPSK